MTIEFKRPKAVSATIELTPLIDIIFQLLIFFMITSSISQSSLELQLPRFGAQESLQDLPKCVLSVFSDGSLKLNGEVILENHLIEHLSRDCGEKESVYLEADQAVPYERILKILKQVREAGVGSVNFLHEME